MKVKVLTYSIISFVLQNIWTLYLFFDYFTEKEQMFHGLGLFFNFVHSMIYAVGLGCFLLVLRLVMFLKNKSNPLKSNFIYILCGIFNLNIFIVWLICIILKILEIGNGMLASFAFGSLLISGFIISDIYKSCFKIRND
ncbi:hypothetical protein [Flavobacterium proteolyticum]|uniref:Uncharacterized protein n=1 Tax=Flavobacterium proteolyticum TaxID=2911683 RepID=A0ABR9WT46_9FLAO|nr:hypothetical protein [Flavobacterium proteolyticum]MBE9576741.1 hypothetical protein [Flavobacterium proteolyticum]